MTIPLVHLFDGQRSVSILELMEQPLRVIVLTAQVQAGMWRRNGFSLLNQVTWLSWSHVSVTLV